MHIEEAGDAYTREQVQLVARARSTGSGHGANCTLASLRLMQVVRAHRSEPAAKPRQNPFSNATSFSLVSRSSSSVSISTRVDSWMFSRSSALIRALSAERSTHGSASSHGPTSPTSEGVGRPTVTSAAVEAFDSTLDGAGEAILGIGGIGACSVAGGTDWLPTCGTSVLIACSVRVAFESTLSTRLARGSSGVSPAMTASAPCCSENSASCSSWAAT
mmetsp:Transcript_9305/g.20968  ORF Transcript_9305/g.20968 Transcript_9305/m.20968 type:complete len:218 (+) Transcript_9305:65-718(+)